MLHSLHYACLYMLRACCTYVPTYPSVSTTYRLVFHPPFLAYSSVSLAQQILKFRSTICKESGVCLLVYLPVSVLSINLSEIVLISFAGLVLPCDEVEQ